MKYDVGAIISRTFSWWVQVLFKTFSLKKWLILTFVAIMAGSIGFNYRAGTPLGSGTSQLSTTSFYYQSIESDAFAQDNCAPDTNGFFDDEGPLGEKIKALITDPESRPAVIMISAGVFLFFILVTVFMWLSARFQYIFIDDVVKNDASIKPPWREFKKEGNNLFCFYLIINLINLFIMLGVLFSAFRNLYYLGVFTDQYAGGFWLAFKSVLPHALFLIFIIFTFGFINMIIRDFALPIIYAGRLSLLEGIRKAFSVIGSNVGNFLLYFMLKIAFSLGMAFYAFAVGIIGGIIGIIVTLLSMVFGLIPVAGLFLSVVVLFILSFVLSFLVTSLLLPVAVFFRTFSIMYLGSLEPQYELINPSL